MSDIGSEIESILSDLASKMKCVRCNESLMGDQAISAASIIDLKFPAVGWHRVGSLCGSCSVDLLVFMFPGLADGTDRFGASLVADVRSTIDLLRREGGNRQ